MREIEVEVPAEVVAGETATLVEKYQRVARLPGFRKGKAPASVIRQRFTEELKTEVVENLAPKFLREAAAKQGLTPVSQPKITDLHLQEGEPLRFKATFEVMPEIEVSGYQELRPEAKDISVSDEEVEQALHNLREQQAAYTAVEDRPLQDGDFAQVAFTGAPQGQGSEVGKPVKVDDVMVEIGGHDTVKEFTENLRGARPGEEKTFAVNYASDFADTRLAGKAFSYSVSIKAVKQKNLPALDDELAKQVGEFETLDALKQRIRESLTAEKQHAAERQAKEKIVDELVKRHDFSVPEALVERQIDLRVERGLRALTSQGMRAEDLKKMDFARVRAAQREAARKEVKAALILERIADQEKIEVTDEEVEREVAVLATQSKQPVEQVRARLQREGALPRLRDRIRNEKTLDYLYGQSA